MLNPSFREYEKYRAAQNICAVYDNKELLSEEIDESIGVWNPNVLQINQFQQWSQYFIKASTHTQWGLFNTEENKITQDSTKTSASTQLELLDSEENKLQQLIMKIRVSASTLCNQKLLNIVERIFTLLKDAKEEDEFCIGITPESLSNFYSFISTHNDLKRPKLSLTPENNIYASWNAAKDKVFSVHFLANGDARFVIFKPNSRHPDKPIRFSGIAPMDDLMQEVIKPQNLYWVLE